MNNNQYANAPGYSPGGATLATNSMHGLFASGTLTDGNAVVVDMTGAPLPATIDVRPASGDVVTVWYSKNGGLAYDVRVATSNNYEDLLQSGITHLKFQRTSGTGTTSTWSIC